MTESREGVAWGWWGRVDCQGAQGILWAEGNVIVVVVTWGQTFVKTQTVHSEHVHFVVCNVDLGGWGWGVKVVFCFFTRMTSPQPKKMARAPATTKSTKHCTYVPGNLSGAFIHWLNEASHQPLGWVLSSPKLSKVKTFA